MQDQVTIPLCADEAYTDAVDAVRLLEHPNIHCISIKVSKFGGVENTLRFVAYAKAMGRVVWMGASDGCGIGRRVSAAFEMLPDMVFPGDLGSVARQFSADFTTPPYVAVNGLVGLNPSGYEYGIGCTLNREVLGALTVNRIVLA